MPQFTFAPQNPANIMGLMGVSDSNLKLLADGYDLTIADIGDSILIDSPDERKVRLVIEVLAALEKVADSGMNIAAPDVVGAIKMAKKETIELFGDLYNKVLIRSAKGCPIRPKNVGQQTYIAAIQKSDIVFGIGPVDTGKTFLAVIVVVSAFRNGEVSRIILTRPAVEAGESLGFSPGDLKEKADPCSHPIYDSLYAALDTETTSRLMEREVIKVAPLAYIRGHTLNEAYVILDETQNTTDAQMKMFLTRLGFNSKMTVNEDVTQVDLPGKQHSGLLDAVHILEDVDQIKFVNFTFNNVVRHPVVAKIIRAHGEEGR